MTLNSSAVYRIGVAVFWNTSWNLPQSSQPVYTWGIFIFEFEVEEFFLYLGALFYYVTQCFS
jgi:hypothetical protein